MKRLLAILILAFSAPVVAQVYKCAQGGRIIYSQRPCAQNAEPLNVVPSNGIVSPSSIRSSSVSVAPDSEEDLIAGRRLVERSNNAAKRRILDDRIKRKELELAKTEREKSEKLAQFPKGSCAIKKNRAVSGYTLKIDEARREISALQTQKQNIGK